jgi:hypothetical protein
MPDETAQPPSRLSRWALGVAIVASAGAIVLEVVRVWLGHRARWEGALAGLIILVIALALLRRTRRR